MDTVYHPVSGEKGFFCSELEKTLIDAIISDYSMNHLVRTTSANGRGVADE